VPPFELEATVIGLVGALGSLPAHYTELVVRRERLNDSAFRDFVAVFEHRILSLFHRAWSKYRLVPSAERAAGRGGEDPVSAALYAIAGFGTRGLRERLRVLDPVFVRFGASFAGAPRPACTLEAMLEDYFGLPAEVESFRIEVLTLEIRDRTRIGTPSRGTGVHHTLGDDAVLGRHAADACGRFRVRIGPVDYATYCRFLPRGDLLRPYCELIRAYVGVSPAFSLCPVLLPNEAPQCVLAAEGPGSPRLGWNTWLRTDPIDRTFDGVDLEVDVLRAEEIETTGREVARR
jgi:type VI secretion system protein ImpH